MASAVIIASVTSAASAGVVLLMLLVLCIRRWRPSRYEDHIPCFPGQDDHDVDAGWQVMTPSNSTKTAFNARGGNKISEPSGKIFGTQTVAPSVKPSASGK
ncbi:hypothetical protein KC19_7G050400 [Ceratodon purpureus]|uniref:Uncharacterized protein n=1 Tax=Ceratodon purpureus TaxID=3225 RepID=A0A8T0H4U0_CERPU|nr:hypothetical protein KC19_7G050400 [Ceratodon purpureus]